MLEEDDYSNGYGNVLSRTNGRSIQGGAIRSFKFAPKVEKLQVLLETSGLPLCARIEISQGPDNNKQVMDIYSEDGKRFPLYLAVDLPSSTGLGHVMRIINASTMEFPIKVWVDSYTKSATPAAGFSDLKQSPRILEGSMKDGTGIPAFQVPKLEDSESYQARWEMNIQRNDRDAKGVKRLNYGQILSYKSWEVIHQAFGYVKGDFVAVDALYHLCPPEPKLPAWRHLSLSDGIAIGPQTLAGHQQDDKHQRTQAIIKISAAWMPEWVFFLHSYHVHVHTQTLATL